MTKAGTYEQSAQEIQSVIKQYFDGIFCGKTDLLQEVFHPQALLYGDIEGRPYFKTLGEYIEGVKNRQSPHALGEAFRMKVLSIEVLGRVAYVRLHCPMLKFNYYDYLALNESDGRWRIVNKLFTHVDPQP